MSERSRPNQEPTTNREPEEAAADLPWSTVEGDSPGLLPLVSKLSQAIDLEVRAEELLKGYVSAKQATRSLGPGDVDDLVVIILGWENESVDGFFHRMLSSLDPLEVLKTAPDSPVGMADVILQLRDMMAAGEELARLLPRLSLLSTEADGDLRVLVDRAARLQSLLDAAEQRLAGLGWRLDNRDRLVEIRDGRGRRKSYQSRIVCQLVDYLRGARPFAGNTAELQANIHYLLEPIYGESLTRPQLRALIDNCDRGR